MPVLLHMLSQTHSTADIHMNLRQHRMQIHAHRRLRRLIRLSMTRAAATRRCCAITARLARIKYGFST